MDKKEFALQEHEKWGGDQPGKGTQPTGAFCGVHSGRSGALSENSRGC